MGREVQQGNTRFCVVYVRKYPFSVLVSCKIMWNLLNNEIIVILNLAESNVFINCTVGFLNFLLPFIVNFI